MTLVRGCAPACCDRLCESVPSSTLAVRLSVTKDGSPTRRSTLPMELPRHASRTRPPPAAGAFSSLSLVLACPRQDTSRCSRHTRMPRSAISPFGSGRPLRPWLIVNPGEGTAAPWASWLQPSSENNFPCATRIPRGTNSFRFQVLDDVAPAARCRQPIPRRPVHNKDAMGATLFNPKGETSWLTSAPSP